MESAEGTAEQSTIIYMCREVYIDQEYCSYRFATMQSAATVAPTRRPPPTLDVGSPDPEAASSSTQDPALVSQLQARFDALAIEEGHSEGIERQSQGETGSGLDGQTMGVMLDHFPSILVLDGELQRIPWESIPALQRQR